MRTIRRSRGLLLIFRLAILPALAFAQSGLTPSSSTFSLQGTVINSVTGQPIPRALVQITSTPMRSMLTGPEGEFAFDNLTQSTAYVQVTKPGYLPPGRGSFSQRSLRLGPETTKLILKLIPEAVISGQVTGTDNEPVEGATVEALALRNDRGLQVITPAYRRGFGLTDTLPSQVQTDEDGNYRIAGLAPGNYYVTVKTNILKLRGRAQARTDFAAPKGSGDYPAVVYYPGVTQFESAMPVQVAGGQRLAADFQLKRVPSFKIGGVVTGPANWKQINPPMIVDESDQTLFSADEFSESGAFTFRSIPAGTYMLRVGGTDQSGMYHAAYHKLVVGRALTSLKFDIPEPITILVRVHSELSKPRLTGHCTTTGHDGKTRMSDCSDYPLISLEMFSADMRRASNTVGYGPQPDPNDLKLQNVMPGQYWLRAQARFGGYVWALRSGSVDLLHDPLVVPNEGGVPPIEVTLRDDTAAVKLQLHSNTPGQAGWAVLVPDLLSRDPLVLDLHAGTDRDYSGIPPGNYKVFAVESMEGIDVNNPESLGKYLENANSISLAANSNTTISLNLLGTDEQGQ